MPTDVSSLFQPLQLGSLTLPNRIVMAPLTRNRADHATDAPNDLNARYYAQRASAGLLITEASQISREGQGYIWTPGIHTPEQIAGWRKRGEERGLRPVSTETIYAFVHRAGQKGERLWKLLPRGRAKRGRRRARQPRSTIAERRSIHDRPAQVQERQAAGHWEGDLLICKRTRPVLVLKERKTRFVLAPGSPASRRPRPWR